MVLEVFEVCIHFTQAQKNVDALQLAKETRSDIPGSLTVFVREDFQNRLAAAPVVLDHEIHSGS